jgi:subtilase family serine protease
MLEYLVLLLIPLAFLPIIMDRMYPEKTIEEDIDGLKSKIQTLEERNWKAKIISWVYCPWLKGDIDLHIELLNRIIDIAEQELETVEEFKCIKKEKDFDKRR